MKKSLVSLASLFSLGVASAAATAATTAATTAVAQTRPAKRKPRVQKAQPVVNSSEIIKHNEMIEMKRVMKQARKAQRRQS